MDYRHHLSGLFLLLSGLGAGCDGTPHGAEGDCPAGTFWRSEPMEPGDQVDGVKTAGSCNRLVQDFPWVPVGESPVVHSVTPASAPAEQALRLTISGLHLTPNAQVRLCHQPASMVEYVAPETLIATFPPLPGISSFCPIEVQTSPSTKVEQSDLFSFYPWEPPRLWGEPAVGGRPCSVRVGDFDGDGFDDAITVDSLAPAWATTYLFPHAETGSFPINDIKSIKITDLSSNEPGLPIQPRFSDFVSGDFDEDGTLDIALTHAESGELWVLVNRGDATFRNHSKWLHTFNGLISGLAVADLDHDNHLDLIGANPVTAQLIIWRGDGKGNFSLQPPTDLRGAPSGVTLTDLNQDGHVDAVLTSRDMAQVSWLLGDGHGGFGNETMQTACMQPRSLSVTDFDQDGQPDWVMACAPTNAVSIVLGATSKNPRLQMIELPSQPSSIALADLDGNHLVDIVVGVSAGQSIYALRNQQVMPGTFSPPLAMRAAMESNWSHPFSLTTTDANRDGLPDIIVSHKKIGGIAILLSHKLNQ